MSRRFLLWDHDGVLVDTERWYFEATRAVLQQLQIDLSEPQYLEFMAAGRSCWDLARERQLPETRIDTLPDARLPRPAAGPVSSRLPLEPQVR